MNTQIAKPTLGKLKGMIGKTYMYKGENITIINYATLTDEGKTLIDIGSRSFKVSNLTDFIDACLPVDSHDTQLATVDPGTTSLLSSLQQTLLDNIDQVKKNPAYIKQANVVNSSVNSLIGLAKIQIQVNKMKKF